MSEDKFANILIIVTDKRNVVIIKIPITQR